MSASTSEHRIRATFGGAFRAEWIKIATLRSTAWTGVLAVVCGALVAVFQASGVAGGAPDNAAVASVELAVVTSGVGVAQLLVCVVATVAGAAEFGSQTSRVTFAVVPRRHLVLWAKFAVVAGFAVAIGVLGTLAAALGMALILLQRGFPLLLGGVEVMLPVASSWLFLALSAVVACAVGLLARSVAWAVSFVLVVMALAPFALVVASVSLQDPLFTNLAYLLPSTPAASSMYMWPGFAVPSRSGGEFGFTPLQPWQGALVMLTWAVAASVCTVGIVRRRDV